jgi:peptide/nickel transport system permease protein
MAAGLPRAVLPPASAAPARPRRRAPAGWLATWPQRLALAAFGLIVAAVLIGPYVAPHPPDSLVGIPFTGPGHGALLGTDALGRDVLSRILNGGRSLVVVAAAATAAAYLAGVAAGLAAGYTRSLIDPVVMRLIDVVIAFPPLLLLLVLASGAGHSLIGLTLGIAVVQFPGVARITRSAALQVSVRGYVEAATARGEPTPHILVREILPNIRTTLVADAGTRLTISILLVAALSFLGFGERPPAPDWASMISENQAGLALNPWAALAPALVIAVLTVSLNILADGVVRRRPATAAPVPR